MDIRGEVANRSLHSLVKRSADQVKQHAESVRKQLADAGLPASVESAEHTQGLPDAVWAKVERDHRVSLGESVRSPGLAWDTHLDATAAGLPTNEGLERLVSRVAGAEL